MSRSGSRTTSQGCATVTLICIGIITAPSVGAIVLLFGFPLTVAIISAVVTLGFLTVIGVGIDILVLLFG